MGFVLYWHRLPVPQLRKVVDQGIRQRLSLPSEANADRDITAEKTIGIAHLLHDREYLLLMGQLPGNRNRTDVDKARWVYLCYIHLTHVKKGFTGQHSHPSHESI